MTESAKAFLALILAITLSAGMAYFIAYQTATIQWSENTKFILEKRTKTPDGFQHAFDIVGSERYFYLSSDKKVGVVGDTLKFQMLFTLD